MVKSLLVIRFSAIGDILLTAPVLQALAEKGVEVDLLVKERNTSVAHTLPSVRAVYCWEKDRARLQKYSKEHYDAVLDLQGTRQSKLFAKGLELPRATFDKPYLRRALLLWTKSQRFALSPVVERYQRAAEELVPEIRLSRNPSFLLNDLSAVPEAPYVLLVIGGSQRGKRLSAEAWSQILASLDRFSISCVLLGGPSDNRMAEQLCAAYPNALDATHTSIQQGLAVVSRANLVVSGDTGFMHAAALLGKPLVSFWGATHPSLGFAPWPARENQYRVCTKSRLSPLHKHGKVPFWASNPMDAVDVKAIITAIEQILQGKTAP